MTGHVRGRLGAALILAVVAMAALAAPAAAAKTTYRYVDDNTGPNRCRGTNFHTIQAAIDASNAKDVVYVCPGTYREQLTIDVRGLTVQSLKFRRAGIEPPAIMDGPALVEITAPGAKLRGFHIEMPAGDAVLGPFANPTGGLEESCSRVEAAVVVLAPRVGVWGNYINTSGEASLSGECGYDMGILFLGEETVTAAPALGSQKSSAKRNYIRDFKLAGILVEGAQSVRVLRNDIRFVHLDDPATCVLVNTVQVTPQAQYPCAPVAPVGPSQLNGLFRDSVGIGVGFGALVDVAFNTVHSTLDTSQIFNGGEGVPLFSGIHFFGAADGSRITENVVTQVFLGIAVDADSLTLAQPGARTTGIPMEPVGVEVSLNRVNEGFIGIDVGSDDNFLYANRARLNLAGIVVGGQDNYLLNNDARYNFEVDCSDVSGPGGPGPDGIYNIWENNFGFNNSPEEICIDTGGPF